MTKGYEVLVYNSAELSQHVLALNNHFEITEFQHFEQLSKLTSKNEYHFILIDILESGTESIEALKSIKKVLESGLKDLPIVLFIENINLDMQLAAFEIGVDDCISTREPAESIITRLQGTIYNAIANKQLKGQLKAATDVAMSAMSSTSDLGCNIQFLLDSNQCENFDQLGQLLFQSLNHYSLTCSLQMRGRFMVKNMEANGMARPMESQLLSELKNEKRFYDFGCRTVVNYGAVSILIKDMPIDDEVKYGVIKDNIFALLQGVEARMKALDIQTSLLKEREMQENLMLKLQEAIYGMGANYQDLTKNIAGVVDHMANSIEDSILTLLLTDEQEQILKDHLEHGRNSVCDLFEMYANMDEGLKRIVEQVSAIHQLKDEPEYEQIIADNLKKSA